jgi:lipid-binding SYLF domain-containing protein
MQGCRIAVSAGLAALALLPGCATPRGGSIDEKRDYVRNMRDEALDTLYKARPDLRERVESAAGYAAFSNVNIHLLLLSAGHGYGIVVDNRDGSETFMRMGEIGAGLGAGLKDLRAVFVFHDAELMDRFVRHGWEFGGQAEAAAVSGDTGGNVRGDATATTGGSSAGVAGKAKERGADAVGELEIYTLTRAGVALQATIAGTKYWKDRSLN